MKGAFNESNLSQFLNDLINGKAVLEEIKTEIKFKKADKWDGKDAKPLDEVNLIEIIIIRVLQRSYERHHPHHPSDYY